MNVHMLTSGVGLMLLGGSVYYAASIDTLVPAVGEPKLQPKERVTSLALDVPNIADFARYYGEEGRDDAWRDMNPFVPWADRIAERDRRKKKDHRSKNPEVATVLPPPPERKPEPKITMPVWIEPKIGDTPDGFPRLVSVVAAGEDVRLRVRFGKQGDVVPMQVGGQSNGWTLESIVDSVAMFRNVDGVLFPAKLAVTGQMELSAAGGTSGGTTIPTAGGDTTSPTPTTAAGGDANARMAQMILQQMEATPQGRAALKKFPNLRERILKDPNGALEFIKGGSKKP